MALAQVVNLYFDTTKYGSPSSILLRGLNDPTPLSAAGLIAQDIFTLNLWPRVTSQQQGAGTTTQQLANPAQMGFTGKAVNNLGAATTLFNCFGFTELQDLNGNYYYQSILSLNTNELIAGVLGKSYLNVLGEIENVGLLLGGVTQEQRLQLPITVYPAVYTGTEGSPAPGSPGYYTTVQSDARYLPRLASGIGSQPIAAGVDVVTVAGLGLGTTPALFIPQVIKADGTRANLDAVLRGGWSANGFTVDLTGVTPDATYLLSWIVIPNSVAVGSINLPAGIDSLTVPLALNAAPSFILPVLVKQAGAPNLRPFLRGGWTGANFTVDFSALTPDATYVLSYLIIP